MVLCVATKANVIGSWQHAAAHDIAGISSLSLHTLTEVALDLADASFSTLRIAASPMPGGSQCDIEDHVARP
jgi:hypothetical protein